MTNKEYRLSIEFYGFPAYVIDGLLERGLHGTTREGVVERIVADWTMEHMDELHNQGITFQNARQKKYVPIRMKSK